MNTVTVNKETLREALEENLQTHEADFEIAWKAFRKMAVHNFEERLRQLKSLKTGEEVNLYVNLTVPQNHADDYRQAIAMLDWEVHDEVTLTLQEFAQFVQDEWRWKHEFSTSNKFYTASASPSSHS